MVIFKLGGGLGNQLFQYAFLYAKLKENNIMQTEVMMVMHRNKYEDPRCFSLSPYNCSVKMRPIMEDKAGNCLFILDKTRKFITKIGKLLTLSDYQVASILNSIGITYAPKIYEFYSELQINTRTKFVEGAFQSWKYFDAYREELLEEFKCNVKLSFDNKQMLERITTSNSVCVHIRRGDYVNGHYSNSLAVCGYDYYAEGIRYLSKKIENPQFFIFTNSHDDHEWIKANYQFGIEPIYVDLNNSDYEELQLMSSCKHFIIANSTFSWWAQYLSKNENKIVVAPSIWNRNGNGFENLYQNFWKILKVD